MPNELTVNETAILADVPKRSVEKTIEIGVVKPKFRVMALSGRKARVLPIETVAYLSLLKSSALGELSPKGKKTIWTHIRNAFAHNHTFVELGMGLSLDIHTLDEEWVSKARTYVEARDEYLDSDPEIFGGAVVVKGTRLPVFAIRDRVKDGDTLEDLLEDYPDVSRDAFEAAILYAESHPKRGRPAAGGRPWEEHPAADG